jgi:hypothetical protein
MFIFIVPITFDCYKLAIIWKKGSVGVMNSATGIINTISHIMTFTVCNAGWTWSPIHILAVYLPVLSFARKFNERLDISNRVFSGKEAKQVLCTNVVYKYTLACPSTFL